MASITVTFDDKDNPAAEQSITVRRDGLVLVAFDRTNALQFQRQIGAAIADMDWHNAMHFYVTAWNTNKEHIVARCPNMETALALCGHKLPPSYRIADGTNQVSEWHLRPLVGKPHDTACQRCIRSYHKQKGQ